MNGQRKLRLNQPSQVGCGERSSMTRIANPVSESCEQRRVQKGAYR